jgi:LAO/AO transport system kinase
MTARDFANAERVALARRISAIERHAYGGRDALPEPLRIAALRSRVLGITGPPGAGKSTLVDALIGLYRARDCRVGVLAVDPSSPVHGGAVLGDRIRMHRHAGDTGVFIRSMGSRGRTDGLAPAVREATRALAAAGYDPILVETVGVGQTELGIVECCDLRMLVLAPAWGDYVQAAKAGLIDVVDLVVVNKADLPGADGLVNDLRQSARSARHGELEIVRAVAERGEPGIPEVDSALDRLWTRLAPELLAVRRMEAAAAELANRAIALVARGPLARVTAAGTTRRLAAAVCEGQMSAAEAAALLYREMFGTSP